MKICEALYSDSFPLSVYLCWLATLETCLSWWSKGVFPLISAGLGVLLFSWTSSSFQLHQSKCYEGQRSCNTRIILWDKRSLLLILLLYLSSCAYVSSCVLHPDPMQRHQPQFSCAEPPCCGQPSDPVSGIRSGAHWPWYWGYPCWTSPKHVF